MSMLEWSDSLSVGIDEIDNQHMALVDMVNKVHDMLIAGETSQNHVLELVEDMRKYSVEHFGTEEKYMEVYEYPDAPAHRLEHAEFIEKITEVEKGCIDQTCTMSMDILNYLSAWLVNHINNTDKKMGKYLLSKAG